MNETEIHHLAAAYVLDALDATERAVFEAHFVSCDLCRVDVGEFRATAGALGESVATPPPVELKSRVMAQIATTRQLPPLAGEAERPSRRADQEIGRTARAGFMAIAAAAVLVIGAFVVSMNGRGFEDSVAQIVTDPTAQVAELSGDAAGQIRVTWVDDRAVVVGAGLPVPSTGEVYELWLIDEAGAHPIRLLDDATEGTIRQVVTIDEGRRPLSWGVTIEPASGSSAPTGAVLYSARA